MPSNLQKLVYVIIGYIFIFSLQTISVVFSKYFETKFANLLKIDIKKKLLEIYANISYKVYEQYNVGDIRLRIEVDTDKIISFYTNHCVNFIFSIVGSIIMMVIIFLMNWYLTLFGLTMIIVSFFMSKILGKKMKKISLEYRENQGEFESIIHKALQSWKEIKTNNLQENEEILLEEKWSVLSKILVKMTVYQYLHGALIAFNLFFVTRMSLYFFGGVLIIYNKMNVATMLVFMSYYEQIYNNIKVAIDSIIELSADAPQLEGIFSVLKHKNQGEIKDKIPKNFESGLYIDNVSYYYCTPNDYILQNITTLIKINQSTAIVGQSGCGKSTLVKLILGLYEPKQGTIYLGETDISRISDESRNRLINVVMQDPIFFNMSILDNLLMANPSATMEEVDTSCKMANIYDFIQSIPEQYDTIIGEQGIKLSGGQRQRLAIARTLLLDPEIIIFDEATSSLDSENKNLIVDAINKLSEQKTIISISHRFSTIAGYDNVIVLQDGYIITQGYMKDLLEQKELFTSIFTDR